MRKTELLVVLGLTGLIGNTAWTAYVPLRVDVEGDRPQVRVLRHDQDQVEFEVQLPGVELSEGILEGHVWDRVEIPGGGYELDLGAPEVPHFTRLLAVPATAGVRAEFEALDVETLSDIELMPAQGKDPQDVMLDKQPIRYDMAAYSQDTYYPAQEVTTGEPALMRGLRVVPVRMHPLRYNPVARELRIAHRFKVTVYFEETDLRNVPPRPLRPVSRSWAKVMRSAVMNFDELGLDEVVLGPYLIVCENNSSLISNLQPFVDWKKRKGHKVEIATFPPGQNNTYIKNNVILVAYNTWEVPPEFVLLVGDVDGDYALPGWPVGGWPWGTDQIDHPYSQLDGNDILADVSVGRIPADNATELQTMQNKVLGYEKTPYIGNTAWYHQGCLMAGSSSSGISTIQVNRWIKTRMVWNEYTRIDTFWYNMSGSVYWTIVPAVNNGVSIVNYRGCYEMENFDVYDINDLNNGFMLPFVVTITCGTGGFAGSSESYMEYFAAAGQPSEPKGAIACVGTATSLTHTRQNNTIDYGIFTGIFDEGITQAGNALNRAKIELYNTFWPMETSSVEDFSEFAALAGDPGVELYNRDLQYLSCDVPSTITFGQNILNLTVTETGVGPVEEAVACVWKGDELHQVALTDASGQVILPLDVDTPGNVKVTITKQNYYPVVDSLDVIQANVAVGYYNHSIDDDNSGTSSGDGDGTINPGEAVEIPLVFKNYGSSVTATNVSVTASLSDEYITLSDNYETFPNISPGGTSSSYDDFDLMVADHCPHGHLIRLDLTATSNQGSWDGLLDLEVISSDMTILRAYAAGTDTLLSPGETANFILEVKNEGGKSASSLTAAITSLDPFVTVNDNSASFGTVNVGASTVCSGNPFNLTADGETPPGHFADLEVVFTSSTGATQTDTITVALGAKSQSDPQGPDEYGYYCFDNTDLNYAQAPTYSWVEIDPSYGGSGTQLPIYDSGENLDASMNRQLPFTFRYYGEDVNAITICSNGWISTWANNSFTDFRNYPIPSHVGPNGMIAPFWDDLKTHSSGYIFERYDQSNHRYIVEWSRLKTVASPYATEVFEVILYDPVYYPTPTGDGEILFQYHTITEVYGLSDDIKYSTVGIERPDQDDGIEVVYWNIYSDPAAAHLQNGRAYRFTTAFDYLIGSPEIDIELIYLSGSPVPSGGGNLNFGISVENASPVSANFDAWIDISYEGGAPTTVILRSFANFQPGWTINRPNMWFPVPGSYAAGNYTFTGRVGDHPGEVWDESGFPFTKLGAYTNNDFTPWVPAEDFPDPFEMIDEVEPVAPSEFTLLGSYPNPFNPVTRISFALPEACKINLSIYDIAGRLVATLVDGYRAAGVHDVTFDASPMASGIYVYHLTAKSGNRLITATGKVLLMK